MVPAPLSSNRISLPHVFLVSSYTDGITHPVSAVSYEEESSQVMAASGKTLVVSDLATSRTKRRLQGHMATINDVVSNENVILTASYDATVRIWDARSRSPEPIQVLSEATDSVVAVAIDTRNGNAILRSASVDGTVRTYDIRRGILQSDDCGSPVTSMAQTRDGLNLALSCLDGHIRLVDVRTGQLVNTYSGHHQAGRFRLQCSFSGDDTTIVTGSEDGSVVFYDVVRGRNVQTLRGPTKPTCSIAPHPEPGCTDRILAASYDGSVLVWEHNDMQ